jgi:hypothetical protein
MKNYNPALTLEDDLWPPEILLYEIMNLHSFADEVYQYDTVKKPLHLEKGGKLQEIGANPSNRVEDMDTTEVEIETAV